MRDYNISKKEWVLDGESVHYGNALELREMLEYDIRMEKEYEYPLNSVSGIIPHMAKFIAGLWQIHAFGEGNTRTTAVFLIMYLRSMGFDVFNKSASSSIVYCLSPSALLFSKICARLIVRAELVPLEMTVFRISLSSDVSLMMIFCLVIVECNPLVFNCKGTKNI